MFAEKVKYYSIHSKTFNITPAYDRKLQDEAFEIEKNRYNKTGKYTVSIENGNNT